MYQQACRIQEGLFAENPHLSIEFGTDLAVYYSDLANLQYDLNQVGDSQESYQRARDCLEPLAVQHPDDTELRFILAVLYVDMAVRRASGDFAHLLKQARSMLESLVIVSPDESRYRSELATLFTAMAMRESQTNLALASLLRANELWERLASDFPSDVEIQRNLVLSMRDYARFLRFSGRHREATDVLNRALNHVGAIVAEDSLDFYSRSKVHMLAMLTRSELLLGDSAGYRRHCRLIVDHCCRRNFYENDALRVCMLLPDAIADYDQLVYLAKDAASQGSETLRKKANIAVALYRAGQYDEAVHELVIVDGSNRMALLAGLGTAEIVRADNARVALFLAM